MNKVLNRPMFKQEALKKGHLEPIRAQTGIMVGQPYSPPGVPAVVPGQGTFSPVNLERFGPPKPTGLQNFARSRPVRFVSSLANIPAYLGYEGTGVVADAMGMSYPTMLSKLKNIGSFRLDEYDKLNDILNLNNK